MFERHFIFRSQTPKDGELIKVHPETPYIEHFNSEETGNVVSWVEPSSGIAGFPGELRSTMFEIIKVFILSIAAGAGFIIGVALMGVL